MRSSKKRSGKSRRTIVLGMGGFVVAVIAGLGLYLGLGARPKPMSEAELTGDRWNILLVSFDTTRPDYLEAHGGGPVATPSLDRVAGNGFVFSEMITPAPITLPSHASLLTGNNPYRHGVRENTEYALPEGTATLASALSTGGYRTAAFVSAFVMNARFGLDAGFEDYVDRLDGPEQGLRPTSVEVPGSILSARVSYWLSRHAAESEAGTEPRPFFLFAHLFDAHKPYQPSGAFARLHPGDPYAGELAFQDACLGQILNTLESTGLSRNTLIWVVSDHGESLGAHGEETHSLFIYDVTQRIVSVLALPTQSGAYSTGAPRLRIDQITGLIDVAPTILDLVGIPEALPETDGRSLLTLLEGKSLEPLPIYCETLSPLVSYHWSPLHGVRTREWKYVRAPIPELYDLRADPGELTNLAAARPTEISELEQALDSFLSGATGRDASRVASDEEKERLRSLGYLAGSSESSTIDLPDPKRMLSFFHQEFQAAKSLLLAGRFDEAIDRFHKALEADPNNTSVWLFLAGAYRQIGEHDHAVAAYKRVIDLTPQTPRAWYGLGRAYLKQVNNGTSASPAEMLENQAFADSATTAFRRALQVLPKSPDAWSGLGEALYTLEEFEESAAAFETALQLGAPAALTHGVLTRIYRDELGQKQKARMHLKVYARLTGLSEGEASQKLPELR